MAMDLNVYNYLMTGYNTKPAASKYQNFVPLCATLRNVQSPHQSIS